MNRSYLLQEQSQRSPQISQGASRLSDQSKSSQEAYCGELHLKQNDTPSEPKKTFKFELYLQRERTKKRSPNQNERVESKDCSGTSNFEKIQKKLVSAQASGFIEYQKEPEEQKSVPGRIKKNKNRFRFPPEQKLNNSVGQNQQNQFLFEENQNPIGQKGQKTFKSVHDIEVEKSLSVSQKPFVPESLEENQSDIRGQTASYDNEDACISKKGKKAESLHEKEGVDVPIKDSILEAHLQNFVRSKSYSIKELSSNKEPKQNCSPDNQKKKSKKNKSRFSKEFDTEKEFDEAERPTSKNQLFKLSNQKLKKSEISICLTSSKKSAQSQISKCLTGERKKLFESELSEKQKQLVLNYRKLCQSISKSTRKVKVFEEVEELEGFQIKDKDSHTYLRLWKYP